jgi:hypothetical protein
VQHPLDVDGERLELRGERADVADVVVVMHVVARQISTRSSVNAPSSSLSRSSCAEVIGDRLELRVELLADDLHERIEPPKSRRRW